MLLKLAVCAAAIATIVFTTPAAAASRTERVTFARGATARIIKGSVHGYDSIDYLIGARAGQQLSVKLTSNRGSNYFNIMPKGDETAYFVGSSDGYVFKGPVPASGDQVIRVYLMRNDARRNVTASYSISIAIVD